MASFFEADCLPITTGSRDGEEVQIHHRGSPGWKVWGEPDRAHP